MAVSVDPFEFEYVPTEIVFGRECVTSLGKTLADLGCERSLLVCGSNVGANRAVMDPIERGLGDRSVGVFDRTTPEKYIGTVLDGAERMRADDVDGLVALGGGSTLNVARAMAATAAHGGSRSAIVDEATETGTVPSPDAGTDPVPIVAVPTTLAGADVSAGGTVNLTSEPKSPATTDEDRLSARISDRRLMAEAIFYDPMLFATTPPGVLTASAMNGFNKGIETVYSRVTTPIGTAHSLYGLRYLRTGLPELTADPTESDAIDHAVVGILLVQYGRCTNLIHTFGNGVSFHYEVQQGTVHGIVTPHVLRYLFDRVDGRRALLAPALGIDPTGRSDAEIADAIVEEVTRIRDALGLPSQLRTVAGLERDHLPAVAQAIVDNPKHSRNPPDLDPTVDEVGSILESAW